MSDPLSEKFEKIDLSGRISVLTTKENYFWLTAKLIEKYQKEVATCNTRFSDTQIVVIFPDTRMCSNFFDFFPSLEKYYFPAIDILPFENKKVSFPTMKSRMRTLENLSSGSSEPIITTLPVMLQKTVKPALLGNYSINLHKGDLCEISDLVEKLTVRGYERVFNVEEPGQFSVRGFITDVFPISDDKPTRIEFFDNEIIDLRLFNPETQKSTEKTLTIKITPAHEYIITPEYKGVFEERIDKLIEKYPQTPFLENLKNKPYDFPYLIPLFYEEFSSFCKEYRNRRTFIYIDLETGLERMRTFENGLFELFPGQWYREIYFRYLRLSESVLLKPENWINISQAPPSFSPELFEGSALKTIYMEEKEKISRLRKEKTSKFLEFPSSIISSMDDLEKEELVVHEDYGIGMYLGNEVVSNFSGTKEYLVLMYDSDVKIFVPVENIDRVHKYVGEKSLVKLTNLRSKQWERTKIKVSEDIEEKIEELIELYALRLTVPGHSFIADYESEKKFHDSFPHIETPDQLKAIEEVLADMEKETPMERLVFGDAGSGKTEVAMRAAFRAAINGFQSALLVPTTVLARQHYDTFTERMEPYAVKVKILDRFITPSEQKKILETLKNGNTDVIIGTHSLLSSKIQFKNLGLLIIDEEQKFGVTQKEKIKKLRKSIDILTLSATPVPRTLYMGLSGVKEMSQIDHLPPGRIPVEVLISRYDEKMIKTAILRELSRGGQVIYVHNRVEDIEGVFDNLTKMVPEAKMGLAHGQMKKSIFERSIEEFYRGDKEILVCTTIIESGVDIPNANTLIIDDSQRYGLAQLYQLRGRVGRSNKRAYAYFFHPGEKKIKPEALSRLEAIFSFNGAGSGLQLAMRDMEIRGIGNLLGFEQHGNINTIGLYLYRQILENILEKHGVKEKKDTGLENANQYVNVEMTGFNFDVLIPDSFIENNIERMKAYRKIALSRNLEDLQSAEEELKDRFGGFPQPLIKLFEYSKLRIAAFLCGIKKLQIIKNSGQAILIFTDLKQFDNFKIGDFSGFKNYENLNVVLMDFKEKDLMKIMKHNLK